jgi:general secretion pathway protein G
LLLRQPRKNTGLYLRAFRSDVQSISLRRALKAALGRRFRICGIRPPRHRASWLWRILFTLAIAFRYIGSERFDLEGSDKNWMARLLASMSRARFAFIDVRDTTVHVAQEIRLAFLALGPSRCVFVVDKSRPSAEWAQFIKASLTLPPEDATALHILTYPGTDETALPVFIASTRETVARIPEGRPKVDDRMIGFVQQHVAAESWKTPFWERDWGQIIFLTLIAWGTGVVMLVLPASARPYAFLTQRGLFLLGILVILVCYFQALRRAWKDAKFAAPFRPPGAWNPKTRLRWSRWLMISSITMSLMAYIILPLAINRLQGSLEFARSIHVQADIQAINTQLRLYESLNGFLPTTEQGLQALVTQPETDPRPARWYQLSKELPKDPWHHDYVYRSPGIKNANSFDLFSAGPDGIPDTVDDQWADE